jgi:hypothetical protein
MELFTLLLKCYVRKILQDELKVNRRELPSALENLAKRESAAKSTLIRHMILQKLSQQLRNSKSQLKG